MYQKGPAPKFCALAAVSLSGGTQGPLSVGFAVRDGPRLPSWVVRGVLGRGSAADLDLPKSGVARPAGMAFLERVGRSVSVVLRVLSRSGLSRVLGWDGGTLPSIPKLCLGLLGGVNRWQTPGTPRLG